MASLPLDPTRPPWQDEGTVDPSWAPPAGPAGRPVRPALVVAVVAVVLGLLVAVVGWRGGFEQRTDVVRDATVGSLLDTGPYQLRFTTATAQQRTDFRNVVTWRVSMVGEGRTTGAESIAPRSTGSRGMFIAKDPATGLVVAEPDSHNFRPGSATYGGSFTPGLPMQPFTVVFEFPASYRPGGTVTFVVYDLEFRDTSLLGNQDPEWANADTAYRLRLPLTVLPPELS